MKVFFFCVPLLACLCAGLAFADDVVTNEWGPMVSNAQMSIALKGGGTEVKINQPVTLLIHINNHSTNETLHFFRLLSSEVSLDFSVSVISPRGTDISPYEGAKPNPHGALSNWGPGETITIAPSQMIEYEFRLSELCKLDEFGVYKIVAKRALTPVAEPKNWFTVTSNPLYVTVVPGEWKGSPDGPSDRPFGAFQPVPGGK